MFLILLLIFAALLLLWVKDKKAGVLPKKPLIILSLLSVAWWAFLVIDQLNLDLVCTPDDEFCNSGNTVWGDISWGSMMAFFSLIFVWSLAIGIYHLIRSLKPKK